jgi:succinate dehydrogenase hydrophobic anchor subunit
MINTILKRKNRVNDQFFKRISGMVLPLLVLLMPIVISSGSSSKEKAMTTMTTMMMTL